MKIIFFESILFIFALFCFVVAVFGQKFVVLLTIDVFYVVFISIVLNLFLYYFQINWV